MIDALLTLVTAAGNGISFEDLGLSQFSKIAVDFGRFELRWYSLAYLAGIRRGTSFVDSVSFELMRTERMLRPRIRTARFVMLAMGLIAGASTLGVMYLADRTGVVFVLDPATLRTDLVTLLA